MFSRQAEQRQAMPSQERPVLDHYLTNQYCSHDGLCCLSVLGHTEGPSKSLFRRCFAAQSKDQRIRNGSAYALQCNAQYNSEREPHPPLRDSPLHVRIGTE
jgi:hypothetical protein